LPKIEGKIKKNKSLQDILFIGGIILLSTVLVVALYPGRLEAGLVDESFFITTIMTIPVIAGIYFIVISFRRKLNIESVDIRESLKKKMTLAFVFIAVLSAMPIVIVSSSYFSKNLASMYSNTTMMALDEAVGLSGEMYEKIAYDIKNEMSSLRTLFHKGTLGYKGKAIDDLIRAGEQRGSKFVVYQSQNDTFTIKENHLSTLPINTQKLIKFYINTDVNDIRIDHLSIDGYDFFSGVFYYHGGLFIICKPIPFKLKSADLLFRNARSDYMEIKRQKDYFESAASSFLMFLSIVIIVIAYLLSLYMSQNITHPLHELSLAAKDIAMGNTKISLKKKSDDEIGVLIDSFNIMARQLEENQKFIYQRQRLQAWNEMARKLVHEIKNPLTPIRLAAERMRKLVMESNPSKDTVVLSGTETIINEVNSLLRLVSNFNDFARLPEKKAELSDLSILLRESVGLFQVYDGIKFDIKAAENLPLVFVDRSLMRQVFNNIITNSIHAMNEKGNITIKLFTESSGLFVVLSIKDDGPGIKEELVDKIFDPGFTLKKNGTGLGLAIVEKIILEHNGRIYCNSKEGEGAEFIIKLPVSEEVINGKDTYS